MGRMNRFASHISTDPDARAAARECARAVHQALDGVRADVAVLFATPSAMAQAQEVLAALDDGLAPATLMGCTAEGVIGTGREVEQEPAMSLWAASLPGVRIEPFALDVREAPDGGVVVAGWPPALDPAAPAALAGDEAVILLADPFTFPSSALEGPDGLGAQRDIVGGMASGGRRPGDHRLILDQRVMPAGAVGIALQGVLPVVS